MGLSSVTGRDLTIKNGHLTPFPHIEAIRKAGSGHSNCQKVAYYVCVGFTLDDSSKLLQGTKSYLKKAYNDTNTDLNNNDLTT